VSYGHGLSACALYRTDTNISRTLELVRPGLRADLRDDDCGKRRYTLWALALLAAPDDFQDALVADLLIIGVIQVATLGESTQTWLISRWYSPRGRGRWRAYLKSDSDMRND